MNAKVFTLRYQSLAQGFDDGPVREFMKDKGLVSLREYFWAAPKIGTRDTRALCQQV